MTELHRPVSEREVFPQELPAQVKVQDVEIRLPVSLADTVDAVRKREGEDPFTGVVPVEETVIPVELESPTDIDDDEPVVAFSIWSDKDREKMVSKQTIEALHARFLKAYGPRWWKHEPEVLLEDLAINKLILDEGGVAKVRALHAVCAAPSGRCPFYTDPNAFMFLTLALSGRSMAPEVMVPPTPEQMSVVMQALQDVRPGLFDEDVLGTIAACCYEHNLWALPGILSVAQRYIYRICDNLGIPVNSERVREVLDLAEKERLDNTTIPDIPETRNQVQALRALSVRNAVDMAMEHGDRQREKVE